jgi:hypothetical protein
MATVVPPTEVEVCGSGATPNKGASRETFRKWIKAYLNLFGASGTPEGACAALGISEIVTNANGKAVKYFDGTLICTKEVLANAVTAVGGITQTSAFAVTPVGFHSVTGSCVFYEGANQTGNILYGATFSAGANVLFFMNVGKSPTNVLPSFSNGTTAAASHQITQQLVGRWKA